jgi:RNA polymerase sigma factor (sigma-70 family)
MTISAQTYDEHRQLIWGICYRMTGSAADADDILQETFVRAMEKPPADMEAPLRPWLVKVAVNLSRDQLRRRRRREYYGPWLPSPIAMEDESSLETAHLFTSEISPAARYDLTESVTLAFLLALEALTPSQRAVLLLRDVFDYSTDEAAAALDMTESNVKVSLHRARRTMGAYDKRRTANRTDRSAQVHETLERFLSRLANGDVEGLKQMLAADVVLVSDGGGEVNALAQPVHGRDKVLRLVAKLYEAQRSVTSTSLGVLNGEPAILIARRRVLPGHASFFTMHCELDEHRRLRRLYFVFAPRKLSALRHPAPSGTQKTATSLIVW